MSALPISSLAPRRVPTVVPLARIRSRLVSLDVFRGLTIIGMIFVNVPGDESASPTQLRHSAWHGWTLADLIFPFFLLVVGITTHLSLESRFERGEDRGSLYVRIIRRGALIFSLGLLLNWFPFYQYGAIAGHEQASFVDHVIGRLMEVRFLGVLQRIGLAYIAAAMLTLGAPTRRVVAITAALLLGYWVALTVIPVPGVGAVGMRLLGEPGRTLSAWVDGVTLDWSRWGLGNHIWENSVVYDPEGLLSTIPATATTMIGVLAGRWFDSAHSLGERLNGLFGAGAVMTVAGLAWSGVFPINKNLWTSSYVLFTAGVALTTLATVAWLVDVRQRTAWIRPFVVFGLNPITAYVGAELLAMLLDSTIKLRAAGRLRSAHELVYQRLLATWMPPAAASLLYSCAFALTMYWLLRVLYRRGIVLKI